MSPCHWPGDYPLSHAGTLIDRASTAEIYELPPNLATSLIYGTLSYSASLSLGFLLCKALQGGKGCSEIIFSF